MKKFTESILIDKENPYSEKIRQEIENVDIEIIVENDLLSHDVLNSMEQMNLLFCFNFELLEAFCDYKINCKIYCYHNYS